MAKETPKIQPTEKPSLYNDEAIIGAGLGSILLDIPISLAAIAAVAAIGPAAAGVAPFLPVATFAASTGIGGLIGGSYGKSRMEHEQKFGKEIKPPSYLNREFFSGGFGGMLTGTVIAIASVGIAAAGGITLAPLATLAVAALPFLGGLVGAAWGASEGKERLEKEYQIGLDQQAQQEKQKSLALGIVQEPGLDKTRSFTKMVEQQRANQQKPSIA
ncbi:MAG: hypothetical protein ACK502_10405 [Alphaproteobacteria bacterium]